MSEKYILELPSLERNVTEFYDRISDEERVCLGEILGVSREYLSSLENQGPFIVAAVGGVLRRKRPELAQDIDIVITGLNYTQEPSWEDTHVERDLQLFSTTVEGYFDALFAKIGPQVQRKTNIKYAEDTSGVPYIKDHKTGEMVYGWYEKFPEVKRPVGVVETIYGTLGSKVRYKEHRNSRPFDIHFSFNNAFEHWQRLQYIQTELSPRSDEKSKEFFYSVLAEIN